MLKRDAFSNKINECNKGLSCTVPLSKTPKAKCWCKAPASYLTVAPPSLSQRSEWMKHCFQAVNGECATSFIPLHLKWWQLADRDSPLARVPASDLQKRARKKSPPVMLMTRRCGDTSDEILWKPYIASEMCSFYLFLFDLSVTGPSPPHPSLHKTLIWSGCLHFPAAHHMQNSCEEQPVYLGVLRGCRGHCGWLSPLLMHNRDFDKRQQEEGKILHGGTKIDHSVWTQLVRLSYDRHRGFSVITSKCEVRL